MLQGFRGRWTAPIVLIGSILLGGCAQAERRQDPLEPFNRQMFAFNDTVDGAILKPLAKGYVNVLPTPVRNSVGNVFDNLRTPTTIINQFLQGKPGEGMRDIGRFVINSTVGVLGIFDVASRSGLEKDVEDFGQTLAVWGVPSGPYLVVPFIGASGFRDGAGDIAGLFTYPPTYAEDEFRFSAFVTEFIDLRAQLLEVEKLVGGDRYLFIRDAYLQRRADLIRDGEADESDPFLDE
ncbi:MlaA family lipoprotein [Chromatocurvus halotolerans]|nr:VacJ family lipoprotein [Chromatocurvus halotolerans]